MRPMSSENNTRSEQKIDAKYNHQSDKRQSSVAALQGTQTTVEPDRDAEQMFRPFRNKKLSNVNVLDD